MNIWIYEKMLLSLIDNKNSKTNSGSPVAAAIHDGNRILICKTNGKSGYLDKLSEKENISRQNPEEHAEALCLIKINVDEKKAKKILITIPPCIECYKKLSNTDLEIEYLLPYHLKVREEEYRRENNYSKEVKSHTIKGKNKFKKKVIVDEILKFFIDYKKNTFILRALEANGLRRKFNKYKVMDMNFIHAINIFFDKDVFVHNDQYDFWPEEGHLEIWVKEIYGKDIVVEYPKNKNIIKK